MDPYEVAQKLANCGFRSQVTRTFWGPGRSTRARRLIKNGLNFTSRLSQQVSLRTSFYYGIHGTKL